MKHLFPILLLFLSPFYTFGKVTDSLQIVSDQNATFNWGAKIGFNSILPVINSFVVEDVVIENSRVEYKVGYMAAFFCRVNIERFFVQPSISWHNNESDVYFSYPREFAGSEVNAPNGMKDQLNLKIRSLELPILIGYNIVKEKPFGLSIMAGPKVKYNYKIRYKSNLEDFQYEYTSDDTAYRINLVAGIGVTLWNLFFDFTYDIGLNYKEKNFRRVDDDTPMPGNMMFDKRLNMMGFSLGLLF